MLGENGSVWRSTPLESRANVARFTLRLVPAQNSKVFVKTNKNDAQACAEAANRPTIRFVETKS
jgi:hypothetical protein